MRSTPRWSRSNGRWLEFYAPASLSDRASPPPIARDRPGLHRGRAASASPPVKRRAARRCRDRHQRRAPVAGPFRRRHRRGGARDVNDEVILASRRRDWIDEVRYGGCWFNAGIAIGLRPKALSSRQQRLRVGRVYQTTFFRRREGRPPLGVENIASLSPRGELSAGVASRTNCVPHFSTSRQSPGVGPETALTYRAVRVRRQSLRLFGLALLRLAAVCTTGRPVRRRWHRAGARRGANWRRGRLTTVYPLSRLWERTPTSPQPDTRPAPRDARGGGRGRRGSGERSGSLVRAPELERGSGGVRGAWAGGTRAASEAARGRRGPGPGARRRGGGRSLRAGGARRRGRGRRGGPGSNRATSPPARGPRRSSRPGAPPTRRRHRGAARGCCAAASGGRGRAEGRAPGAPGDEPRRHRASRPRATRRRRVGRESRGDAGGGRLVRRRRTAEHVKETLDRFQLARRARSRVTALDRAARPRRDRGPSAAPPSTGTARERKTPRRSRRSRAHRWGAARQGLAGAGAAVAIPFQPGDDFSE